MGVGVEGGAISVPLAGMGIVDSGVGVITFPEPLGALLVSLAPSPPPHAANASKSVTNPAKAR